MSRMRCPLPVVITVIALWTVSPAYGAAANPSTEAANTLVSLMKARSLDAVAVQDPQDPDRFIAAMLVPGVQLLVVAAKSTAPEYLRTQLAQQQYREVYSALFSAAVMDTKWFFQDMGCDGLRQEDQSLDILYERGTEQTIFDGDWKAQKRSRADYDAKLRDTESHYGRTLALLIESLRPTAGGA